MRLIDADNYCENICRCCKEACDKEKCPIHNAPTIEAAPVVHGRWEWRECKMGEPHCYCSNCNEKGLLDVEGFYVESEVCPNCGAKMEGGAK